MPCPYLRPLAPARNSDGSPAPHACGARPEPEASQALDPSTQAYLCNDDDLVPFCGHFRRAENAAALAAEASQLQEQRRPAGLRSPRR